MDDFVIDGDMIVVDFMFGNSMVNVELLCDKFIKLYVCDFVCKNGGWVLIWKFELLFV